MHKLPTLKKKPRHDLLPLQYVPVNVWFSSQVKRLIQQGCSLSKTLHFDSFIKYSLSTNLLDWTRKIFVIKYVDWPIVYDILPFLTKIIFPPLFKSDNFSDYVGQKLMLVLMYPHTT